MRPLTAALAALVLLAPAAAQDAHDYLHDRYDALHSSPLQAWYRALAPMPAGAVYIQHPGEGEAEIREHFRTMNGLGFNSLKQIMPVPGWSFAEIAEIALDEGLVPWWYGEGGWAPFTDSLLQALGLPPDVPVGELREHPKMVAYQFDLMRERVRTHAQLAPTLPPGSRVLQGSVVAHDPQVGGRGLDLTPEGERLFLLWLRETYGTVDSLNAAWNLDHSMIAQGLPGDEPFASWADVDAHWRDLTTKEYRHLTDVLRFKAEHGLDEIAGHLVDFRGTFPYAPFRGGGELGLFLPQAWYGVDLERIADLMTDYGTFYPSIHFSWHFSEADHELVRPFYMQAAYARDLFKGGWAATWESSGGPQQFSGSGRGFTVDEGTMRQFILSQLAAGFRGFGLWAWSTRSTGWEGGEYSLLDRNGAVTPRARAVGAIAQAMQTHRDELWQTRKEPYVGVYTDWDNEAIWAAMSVRGRDDFRERPVQARVGAGRALIDANVPWEYVTADDLAGGLAPRYRTIFMPFALAVAPETLALLKAYAEGGGRLVVDLPSFYFDTFGTLFPTGKGSLFEEVFGVTLDDFQYATPERPYTIGDLTFEGFTAYMTPTTADVVETYGDGRPAITEHRLGEGAAILLGHEASMLAARAGNEAAQEKLVDYLLGPYEPPYACDGCIAYRLASPAADHYVLVNDGDAKTVALDTKAYSYRSATDAVTGEPVDPAAVALDAHSARWLRLER